MNKTISVICFCLCLFSISCGIPDELSSITLIHFDWTVDDFEMELSAITVKITNSNGETIVQKVFERNTFVNILSKGIVLTEIQEVEKATLTVSAFGINENGIADLNTPKWEGRVSELNFGEKTFRLISVLLYPKTVQNKELDMPEKLAIPRFGHSATVLHDGRVLVAGGFTSCEANGHCTATESVEIIDMESGKVETLAPMAEKRAMHTAIVLNDGSVLFIGGVQILNTIQQEENFDNFPLLPYSQTGAVATIEHYMPPYPKYNMKENNLGSPIANTTKTIAAYLPFYTLQSVLTARISDTQTEVFLVGGVDENGQPSNKTYKFTITDSTFDNGTIAISSVTEFAKSSSPMLLPALAYSNGSIFAVGGRNNSSESAASLISESESKDLGEKSNNIFFTNSLYANNSLYTFGGMPNQSGTLINSDQNGVIRKWDLNDGSFQTPANGNLLSSNNKNVAFAETLYNAEKNQIILIGGTDAENFYQVINPTDLEDYRTSPSHIMSDKRIMPKASIVPAGVIVDRPVLVITGGTSALNSWGSAVNTIKFNIL